MSSPSPSPKSLVSSSDIADLAGVSRAAVSNWRRRHHDDFPQPAAGTKTKPLYSLSQVQTWLTKQGYTVDRISTEAQVWTAMNTLRGFYSPDQASNIVIALAAERVLGENAPEALQVSRLTSPQDSGQNRIEQVRGVVNSVDESELASVVDFVLERTARAEGRKGSWSDFIAPRTSHLLATVAASHQGGVVYDPACGAASALIRLADTGSFDSYIGHDINERALAVAEVRAALHHVPLELTQGDTLRIDPDPDLRADVVIAEPPFNLRLDYDLRLTDPRFVFGVPPARNADTAWLQHAIAHLTDTGRAFVITAHGALFRGGAEERLRTELLRQGCVETIVGLPGGMSAYTSIPLALWVLRRPNNEQSDVLLIDASEIEAAEEHAAQWLSDAAALEEVPHVRVSVDDQINDDAQLTPKRWLATEEPSVDEVHAAYVDASTAIRKSTQVLVEESDQITFTQDSPSRILTIKDLIREGVIERIRHRAPRDVSDDLKTTMVGARAINTRILPDPPPADLLEDDMELTRPSDILVLTQFDIRALVDDTGGHLLSPVIELVRVLKPDVVNPHYLAAMLSGSWNTRFLAGGGIQRAKITDLEIPLMPMDNQQRLAAALAEVERLRKAADTIVESSGALSNSLLDAVRFNIKIDTIKQ